MRAGLFAAASNGLLTILRMLSNLAVAKFMALYAGPTGVALAGQLQGLAAAATGVVAASTSSGLVRYTAQHRDHGFAACAPWWAACLRWSARLYALVLIVLVGAALPLSQWLLRDTTLWWTVALIGLTTPFAAASVAIPAVLNGLAHHKTYLWASTSAITLSTLTALALIYRFGTTGTLLIACSYAGLLGLATLVACLRQPWLRVGYWWQQADKATLKDTGKYVAMAIASALFVPIAQVAIRNLIYSDAGWQQVGYWQAAQKISDAYMAILASSLSAYYLPRIARAPDKQEIQRAVSETVKIVALLAIATSGLVYGLREQLSVLLYSDSFRPAAEFLSFQAAGNALRAISLVYGYVILSRGASNWFIGLEAIFSLSLVILTWILIKTIGPTGASAAYAVNYLLYLATVKRGLYKFSKIQ